MNKEKQKVIPTLRFPEFNDDGEWEEKLLGEICNYFNGGSNENNVVENGKYNLITLNSIDNGAAGLEARKFYEVAPHIGLTRHTITIRPLLFSGKTFRKLNAKQQRCVTSAGQEAGTYARQLESSEDQQKQDNLKNKGLIQVYEIKNHATLLQKAEKVKQEFAASVGATALLSAINKF